jgi:hypothetical protein
MSKVYISSFNTSANYDYCDNYHKHYFKNFLGSGWVCLNKDDILLEPTLEIYLKKNKIEPSVLYFVDANVIVQNNMKYLEKLDCVKCIFMEDINKTSGRIKNFRKLIGTYFTHVFCPYAYCSENYNLDIPIEKLYWLPHCAVSYLNIDYPKIPLYNKILLSGIVNKNIFPMRQKMLELQKKYPDQIDYLEHPTYNWNKHKYIGHNYYKYLSQYLCCFTCCGTEDTPFICQKFFEIPFSGSLLFCYDKYVKLELGKLGFIDGVNYIGCSDNDMEEKLEYILDPKNYNEIRKIRLFGHYLVKKRHTSLHRVNQISSIINTKSSQKIFISNFNNNPDYQYDDITFKNYYKDFENNGWLCVKNDEITKYENLENFLKANNYTPSILYFCFCNTLIEQNLNYLQRLSIKKCIYVDDLHHSSGRVTNMYNNIFSDFTYIFSSYGYCLQKFYPNTNIDKIVWLPHCAISSISIEYNSSPIKKILLTGSTDKKIYPMRAKVLSLQKKYNIEVLEHPSYRYDKHNIIGSKYYQHINKYLCSFACCSNENTPYLVKKFFEIPYSGALLLAYDKYVKGQLRELGFIDMENYISCDESNLCEKIEFILNPNNISIIEKIRLNGYNHVHQNHTSNERVQFIDNILNNSKNF